MHDQHAACKIGIILLMQHCAEISWYNCIFSSEFHDSFDLMWFNERVNNKQSPNFL